MSSKLVWSQTENNKKLESVRAKSGQDLSAAISEVSELRTETETLKRELEIVIGEKRELTEGQKRILEDLKKVKEEANDKEQKLL
mmetsp:Transcript_5845/g.8649  ORF Transcript_5845/g.8649 Transcript_5845/m.8649 type:complete len:85 (+) Transcript_5845:115-369(+)